MQINHVLRRLCAMLPDENLRVETKMFTTLNIALFLAVFIGLAVCLGLAQAQMLPRAIGRMLHRRQSAGFVVHLIHGPDARWP